jgi:DUF1009 family protein
MAEVGKQEEKLLVVAGSGTYPACLIAGARKAGVRHVSVLALRGAAARATAALGDETVWFGVGQARRFFEWVAQQGFTHSMMVGGIPPSALFRTRFDDLARRWLSEMPVKNAHTLFGKVSAEMTRLGIRMLPASCYMEAYIPDMGVLTQRAPDAREANDIVVGHRVACGIGGFDIGQTVVVKDGMILAVEAFEGTNAAIRRGGKLGGRGAVVVKVAKEDHDMRFDIPVIGRQTLPILRRAGVTALAFQARRLVMLEKDQVIATANRLGIALVGIDSGLPSAPVRP